MYNKLRHLPAVKYLAVFSCPEGGLCEKKYEFTIELT